MGLRKYLSKSIRRKSRTYRSRAKTHANKGKTLRGMIKKSLIAFAETKAKIVAPYTTYLGDPTSVHTYVSSLCDANLITVGTANNQRIGDDIYIQGFKLNMRILNPVGYKHNTETADKLDVLRWTKVKWHLVKYKSTPTCTPTFFPATIGTNVKDVLDTSDQRLTFIKSGEVMFNNTFTTDADDEVKVIRNSREAIINTYVKINKKQQYSGGSSGNYKDTYFFIAYAYANFQGLGVNTYWCNRVLNSAQLAGSQYYHPQLTIGYTIYYKDV